MIKKYISNYAVDDCINLESITIPSDVDDIGEMAFGYILDGSRLVKKENFKIPAWVEKGYRKHKTYKVEELLTVAGEVSVAVKNEIIRNEIAHLEVMKEKAIGYKKKGRAE